jgi:hypothetical protein
MKVFITISFREGKNQEEIEKLCRIVRKAGFEDYCFARDLEATFDNPKEMMQRATEEIEKCDALIFDASTPSISRAIETGISYHAGKKVIVIARTGTELKNPLKGVADAVITYSDINDIQADLQRLYLEWSKT